MLATALTCLPTLPALLPTFTDLLAGSLTAHVHTLASHAVAVHVWPAPASPKPAGPMYASPGLALLPRPPVLPVAPHLPGPFRPELGGAAPSWAMEWLAARRPPKPASLSQIITNLRLWIMGLLAGVATLFLVVGGVRYLAAGGDPSEVERAKSSLKSALIGYALAVLAPVLLTVLNSIIGG